MNQQDRLALMSSILALQSRINDAQAAMEIRYPK